MQGLKTPITDMQKVICQRHTLYLHSTARNGGAAGQHHAGGGTTQRAAGAIIVSGGLKVGHKQLFVADVRISLAHMPAQRLHLTLCSAHASDSLLGLLFTFIPATSVQQLSYDGCRSVGTCAQSAFCVC